MTATDTDPATSELIARLQRLEETARAAKASSDEAVARFAAVERDRDRLLAVNVQIDAQNRALRAVNEQQAVVIERHERAAAAYAALEQQPAKPARSVRRPLTQRGALAWTVLFLGAALADCGFSLDSLGLIVAGAVAAALSAGLLARFASAEDPRHPFDMPVNASKWEVNR